MRILALCALLTWVVSCTSPTDPNTDPPDTQLTRTLNVEAQPSAIPANGIARTTIFVEYRVNGNPVPDSTRIILLNPMGVLAAGTIYTLGGVALDTLTADTIAGLGWLIAYADGVRDSTEIMFTANTP